MGGARNGTRPAFWVTSRHVPWSPFVALSLSQHGGSLKSVVRLRAEQTLQRVALKLADELKHTRAQLAQVSQAEPSQAGPAALRLTDRWFAVHTDQCATQGSI